MTNSNNLSHTTILIAYFKSFEVGNHGDMINVMFADVQKEILTKS